MKDNKYDKKKGSPSKKSSLSDMFNTLEKKSTSWTEDEWKSELSGGPKSKSTGNKSSSGAKSNDGKKTYSDKSNSKSDKYRDSDKKSSEYSSNRSDKRYEDKKSSYGVDKKDSRDFKDKKDSRDFKDRQDSRNFKDKKDSRDFKDKKDSRDFKDSKDSRDYRGSRDRKDNKDYSKQEGHNKFKGSEGKSDQGFRRGKREDRSACKYMRDCGGCNVLEETYPDHLARKQKTVEKLLNKYARVEPIIGMENPFYYRNKVHVVFDHDRRGNPISGLYEENTHRVIPMDKCMIHNEKADAIINSIRGMLKSFKIKTYDEDSGYGLMRHVLIRTGFKTGEIMVVLVLSSPILPSKSNFVKALRKEHPEITTIILNVNDKKTSMVLGAKEHVIYGKGYIEDVLCEKTFHISPQSFYQVNPVQTEVLYSKGIEFAELNGTETIIDAYCGIGTIGFIASDHVKRVIGVELNKDAVKDAVVNMKRNKITNAEVYNRDAGEFMRQAAEAEDTKIDVVFMDPPRAGSDETFLSSVVTLNPEKVVYISCNPITLERDLQYITKKGYKVKKIQPVDMFPWTEHVETVVLMSKVNTKG